MKELTKNEIKQVNGGLVWALAFFALRAYAGYVGRAAVIGAAGGALGGAIAGALERE